METSDYLRILGNWDKDYKEAILDKMFRFYFADPLSFVVYNIHKNFMPKLKTFLKYIDKRG